MPQAYAENPGVHAPAINVVPVIKRDLVETVTVTGTIVAHEDAQVTAQVEGLAIVAILVEEGDHVEKGQNLARLDALALTAQQAQMNANLARAEAANVEAQKALVRTQSLRQSGNSTQAQLEQRVSEARVAEADKLAMQAQRSEIETKLSRTTIRSPVSGIISRRTARVGAIAGAQEPLFTIIEDGQVELEAEISDTQYKMVAAGQEAKIFSANSKEAVPGKVRLVSPQINQETRLGRLRVALLTDKPSPVGGYGRAIIETAKRNSLSVPLSAVSYGKDKTTVQLVQGDVVKTQPVTLGINAAGYVEVLNGLSAGDVVVSRAGTFLRDGDKITPVTTAP